MTAANGLSEEEGERMRRDTWGEWPPPATQTAMAGASKEEEKRKGEEEEGETNRGKNVQKDK